jgi:hypothetical protein
MKPQLYAKIYFSIAFFAFGVVSNDFFLSALTPKETKAKKDKKITQ